MDSGAYPIYEIVLEIEGRPSSKNRMLITDPEDPVWRGTAHALSRGLARRRSVRTGDVSAQMAVARALAGNMPTETETVKPAVLPRKLK